MLLRFDLMDTNLRYCKYFCNDKIITTSKVSTAVYIFSNFCLISKHNFVFIIQLFDRMSR